MRKYAYYWIALLALSVAGFTYAAETVKHPKAPIDIQDTVSLQRGAHLFMNYCIACHSASMMRYNRLTDIGLTEDQIRTYLVPEGGKIGDTISSALRREDGLKWFGTAPPDLSVIARSRGADYLYTYLRGFYRDSSRVSGWNNTAFPMSAMPNVLWELQGEQELKTDANGHQSLVLAKAGSLTRLQNGKANTQEFDKSVADLTNFLVYIGEPAQVTRHQIGYVVLIFLIVFLLPLAYFLNKEYWKDIH